MTASTQAIADLAGDYQLDPAHSRLGFVARHAMVTKIRGQFTEFEGTGHIDVDDPANSAAEVRVAVASVNTQQEQRDGHLRSADFFDVETYPEIAFRSTSIERLDDSTFRVTGDLTINDITRPLTIDFESTGIAKDPFGNVRAGFEGSVVVNRKDWGLQWNAALETGGVLVSDKVTLELDISAIKAD
jgi:polyisoprenoid-binding protein YceI